MAFNRKKLLFAPEVESLIKQLTGFEENEKNFQEVSRYFYQNIIHHNFCTVDFSSVQRSLEGIIDKLNIHGFTRRGKRLEELIERFVTSDLSEHSELQWNVLLLMLRLSYKPMGVPEESLNAVKPALKGSSDEIEEYINWAEYLREGLEDFQCPSNDSDVWSEEDKENEEDEESEKSPTRKSHPVVSPLPSYRGVPHPSLWRPQPLPLTQREVIRSVIREAVKSEQWLRSNIQHTWWSDISCRSVPESKYPAAHTCEIWERSARTDKKHSTLPQLQVISEYKVLQEVLWVLQVPTDTSLFSLGDQGHFSVKPNVSLPTSVPDTLQLAIDVFCSYFSMLHELREFEETLNDLELSENPAPFTFKAYFAELSQQLHHFKETVVAIETRLTKQEETMTLQSVREELTPGLNRLQYLYGIHTRATRGWQMEPPWLQVTRLLSVLYEAFLEANDRTSLEASLSLFINSFHVYLDIIDVWLSEGRLEDWRTEFLVTKVGDRVEVMPYEREMYRRGVVPVTLLIKLVKVVKDAGYTMEVVSQLNKLTDLRDTVDNKGCLFKEFSVNVKNELNRLKGMMNKKPLGIYNSTTGVSEDSVVEEKQESESKLKVDSTSKSSKSEKATLEVCRLVSAGDAVCTGYDAFSVSGEMQESSKKGDDMPRHLTTISSKALYEQTVRTFLSNPLLAEALQDYFNSEETHQSVLSENGLLLDSMTLMGVACLHRILERQVELVETRHKIASRLVLKTLSEEYKLLQHFIVLRNVFFMECGILAQKFYSYLFKEIESGQWRNRVNLTMHLQDYVEEQFPEFHSYFSVHVDRGQVGDEVQQAIQAISIAYMVDWPVTMVISEDTIESYNKVFRFLLHLKYAFWVLQDIRFSELSKSPNTLRVKRLQALKMWMYHSTNTLHSYFMNLVLCRYSDDLDKAVQSASCIRDIIDAHKNYLIQVKTHCLQLKKSHLETFIMKLVWLCQDLADLWMLEAAGSLTDNEVKDLEQHYYRAYMGLSHCLEAITSEIDDHINPLWQLKGEFLNSIPEVWLEDSTTLNCNVCVK